MKRFKLSTNETRRKLLIMLALCFLLGVQSAVFAQGTGIDDVGTAVTTIATDLTTYIIPAIGFVIFIWAGFKVCTGQRDAIPWAAGALAGIIISLNAANIKDWLISIAG